MKFWRYITVAFLISAGCVGTQISPSTREGLTITNSAGFQLLVVDSSVQPRLRIVLPEHPKSDSAIEVLFPEHVSAVKSGGNTVEHLYLGSSATAEDRPRWRRVGRSLEYERDLPHDVHLLARATLENDGVRFRYEFTNRSAIAFDMIYAVTDPRLTGMFHDERLERTYVHHAEGFDLLASETPARLTLPLNQWLPARYLASFTWPVPAQRVERREDGINYYNKSRAVNQPFIATISTDRAWIVASFSRQTGNVWSNPELTCQHVDPQTSLRSGKKAVLEVKIIILRGSLEDALQRAIRQRQSLR